MNREDFIRMAHESHLDVYGLGKDYAKFANALERFAALVAFAEREKVAAWMMQCGYATGHGDTIEDLLKELDWQAKEREREACAIVCDDIHAKYKCPQDTAEKVAIQWCADAIRARGESSIRVQA